ncbi:MAG: VOC family protein [Gammaproteobacteria bacterium]|nr:VOC family protein [Gammaproteobacteria bacterium]
MKNVVAPIPEGYRSITPYLIVNNASQAIEFYKKAFNAVEVLRMDASPNKIGHAELMIGDSKLMLADEFPEMDVRSPEAYGGSPITIHLYVENVDATVDKAIAAGGTLLKPIENMFYGDRSGTLQDPYGHKWHVSTHIEDVSDEETRKRAKELFGSK